MANYSASIDIKVNGGEAIKKVNESLAAVERLTAGIKPVPALFDRRTNTETKQALDNLAALVKEYATAGTSSAKFATSIAGLNSQISTFQRITANAKAGSVDFANSIKASERATLRLVEAEQERLKVLRSIYTGPQNKAGAGGTLASGELNDVFKIAQKTIPTIAGITEQVRILENALEHIDIGTPIFKNVENLIAQRQSLLENARLGGQKSKLPQSAVSTPVQVGLAGTHATTLAGMKAQSTYYNKIEDLQYKQLVTGQQISKANLTQTQQGELQNRLAQASQALAEGELRIATRLTTELKSQRIAYERINSARKTEASKTQTFGALGTGFSPVTGKMPGGGTIPGSIAAFEASTKITKQENTDRKRTENLIKSSEILEQGLVKAKKAGLDVDTEAQHVRRVINTLAQQGLNFSKLQLDQADHILKGLRDELTLKKAIAQNNAVPKAVTSRGTVASVVTKQERLTNTAELLEQSLLQAKIKGLDVSQATARVQQVINTLNRTDLSTDTSQLAVLDKTIKILQHELKLKKAIAQTQQPQGGKAGGGGGAGKAGAGGFFERLSNPSSKLGSAVIGGGFPALMGGGPGAMIGGALGGAVGGFAGSIAASAIGQFIDQAVVSVQTLGNAFALVQDDYSAIRETGIQFTAELESQVRAAKQLGDYTKAAQLQRSALSATGDIGASTGSQTSATEGVAASVNRLNAAWNEVTKTVSLLLGIIGAPTIEIISIILKGVNAILVAVNSLITAVGGLFALIPGFANEIKRSNEEALKTTAEYQNQIAEQDKLIEQAIRLNKANAELNRLALKNVGLLGAEKQAADLELRSKEKQAALEEEILKIKETARTGTAEQQAKATQLEAQARIKSNGEVFKDQIALYGSLYDQITADNINIARQKEDQEVSYRDMVRDTARLQQDLNLDIARKAQDLRVQNIEKENELIKRQADLRISGLELESKKRLSSMAEFVPGIDTEEQQIKIGVTEAVDTLKIGLAKIDAEAADRQRKLKTNLMRLDIENERYKYDMAVRINRLNVDNVNKIAVINTQINRQNQDASRQKYKEGLELLRTQVDAAAIGNKFSLPEAKENVRLAKEQGINTAYYVESLNALETRAVELQNLITKLDALLKKTPEALPSVKQLPTVSGDTSAVGQQSNRLKQLTVDSDRVSGQETQAQIAGLTQAQNTAVTQQITGFAKPVQSLREANDKLLLSEKARLAIIQTGINPQLFEQQTLNTRTYETALKQLNVLKSELQFKKQIGHISEATYTSAIAYIDEVTVGLGVENAALQKNTLELEKQKNISATADFLAQGKGQIAGVEAGMRSGFIGQAQSTYADKITQGFTPEQATAMAAQTQALELATTKARALEGAYNDIGSAMASTLTDGVAGLVAGTTTAEQVFVDFLKNIGDALIKAAQQMIAQYLAIAAAKALAGLFGGGSSGGLPSFGDGGGFGSFEGGALGTASGGLGGGDFTSFLPGKSFYKAAGGPVSGNSTYMVGEKGPELFVPSTAGTIIPADATAAMARYQRQGGGDDNEPDPVAAMARYQRQNGNLGGMSSNRNTTNNANNITNNGYNTNGSNTTNNGYNTDGNNTTNNGYNTDGDNTTNNGYNTDGNNTTNNGYNTAGGNNTTNNQSNTNGNNTTNNRNNTNGNNTTNNQNDSNSNSDTINNIQTSPSPVLAFSFEITRFLGQDYVSTDQLQAAMLATEKRAAASGAKAGAAQVAAQMRNSPGYRRQVGLR